MNKREKANNKCNVLAALDTAPWRQCGLQPELSHNSFSALPVRETRGSHICAMFAIVSCSFIGVHDYLRD